MPFASLAVAVSVTASPRRPAATAGFAQVFVPDLTRGTTALVSLRNGSASGGRFAAFGGSLSGNGACIVFTSDSDDLVTGGYGSDFEHVFLRAFGAACPAAASPPPPRDKTPPVISNLSLTHKRFAVGTYLLASSGSTIRGVRAPVPLVRFGVLPGIHDPVVQQHSADLRRLLAGSWLVLAVTAVASALLGWFASGRVLCPLREMTATARTIPAGNLSERLALSGPDDEFKQLGNTLDDLLARLEASFEAQRRFVANASHELRTPLTLGRTLLQVALADPNASAATLRATCEELLASGREHERMLEALLPLASSERGLDHREPLDLAALAGQVLLTSRPEIERRSLQLVTALAPAPTTGDPALIERLTANLIENAAGYSDTGGRVEIGTSADAGHSLLSVTNRDRWFPRTSSSGCTNRSSGSAATALPEPTAIADWASRSSARSPPPTTPP